MKKFLVSILSVLTMLCTLGLTACSCGGSSVKETYEGIYYEYYNGKYNRSSYIYLVFDGSTWATEEHVMGLYTINNGKIALNSFVGSNLYYGTIKDGVMEINDKTYCKKGSSPNKSNNLSSNSVPNYYSFELLSDGTYEIGVTNEAKKANSIPSEIAIPSEYNNKPVTSIGECAFYDYGRLTSITIPNSVTSIGWSAFQGCRNLTSVKIDNNVTSIGDSAFSHCSSLTSVNFGENSKLTSIGSNAFAHCSSLTSIIIPDSVTSIGHDAFAYCSSLTSAMFNNTNGWKATFYLSGRSNNISSSDLFNPATAAHYLTMSYYDWQRG